MDTTTLLIAGQVALLLLAGVIFLGLYARRQKKAVERLQELLREYRNDMSGDNLTRYLQLAIDETAAQCNQETIALDPAAEPDQLAISLRHDALAAELSQLQTYNGELSPWTTAIAPYNDLAMILHTHMEKIPDAVKAQLLPKIDQLETQLTETKSQYEQIKNQLENYKQLETVYQEATEEGASKQQIEVQMHHALLALAENIEQGEALREVIYLMHEGYLNAQAGGASGDAGNASADSEDDAMESNGDPEEMYKMIEQFTEESADLVERIYMLNNENKLLSTDNNDLREQIKAYTEEAGADEENAPMIAGLKMKIESQVEEILKLQSNFKTLEEKYLALYLDKHGVAPPPLNEPLPTDKDVESDLGFTDIVEPAESEEEPQAATPDQPEEAPPADEPVADAPEATEAPTTTEEAIADDPVATATAEAPAPGKPLADAPPPPMDLEDIDLDAPLPEIEIANGDSSEPDPSNDDEELMVDADEILAEVNQMTGKAAD